MGARILAGVSAVIGVGVWAVSTVGAAAAPVAPKSEPFIFANAATQRCIDDSGGAGLRPFTCNNSNYQKWARTYNNASGTWKLQNTATGRCLDDSGAYGLRSIGCNGGTYQQWYYSTYNGSLTNQATGRCVDDSAAHGLRAYACNNSNYQKWGPFGRPPS